MYPYNRCDKAYTDKTDKACVIRARSAFLFAVLIFAFLGDSFAAVTKTASVRTGVQPAIASSLPLWGGGQLISAMVEQKTTQVKLHHFDDLKCGTCHNTSPTEANKDSGNSNIWKSGVDINKSCTTSGCHSYEDSMNHPIGVSVTGKIPANMQTDSSSRITCITCHEDYQPDTGAANSGTEDETLKRFLYTPTAQQDICVSCHAEGVNTNAGRSHWLFSKKAHLRPITAGASLSSESTKQLFASLDEESNNCLSCHDEVSAVIPAMDETSKQKRLRYKKMSDHPIGMNYQYKANTHPGGFNYPMNNSDDIRLFNGRVGCGSCHSLYSKKKSYLTVEYKGGHLCRSCHNR